MPRGSKEVHMKEHAATAIALRTYEATGDAAVAMDAFLRHGGMESPK